ncbi:MAG TPA: flagellar biosynthesis protein FlgJ [Rhodobacteraceae bacterium]|nr:flagellar biosynthesis protein FlgJ [Paracoccaceae bacterium]
MTISGPAPRVSAHSEPGATGPDTKNQAALRKAAMDLEAAFLTEMLKSAGLGKSRESFGGGAGEDQFNSLLIRAQAEQMTRAGGIGLAESLYHALLETQNDQK